LPVGLQQRAEIVKALYRGVDILILDEPTAVLRPQETDELFGVLRGLAQGGKTIIFITHKLREVMAISDRITVMRRLRDQGVAIIFITHKLREAYAVGDRVSVLRLGRLVGGLDPARLRAMSEDEVTEEVIRLMFGAGEGHGRDAATLLGKGKRRRRAPAAELTVERGGAPALRVRGLATEALLGECPLREVSFDLWPGEGLGIAGVDGNGQKHLAEVLSGQRAADAGQIVIAGQDVTADGVVARRRHGVRYITDERLGEGTVGAFSVATNLVLKEIGAPPLWRRGISLWDRIHAHARGRIEQYDVRTPSERTPVGKLSGGNIQKVLLARELNTEASVVIFSKPTYGLDLHNTNLARARIVEAAEHGLATIVISTELDELLEVSDRIGVMFLGRLAGIVANEAGAERTIGLLMTGAEA
jgi:simple sugar transport system ATP-binding protein